jgi:hypothetical protein
MYDTFHGSFPYDVLGLFFGGRLGSYWLIHEVSGVFFGQNLIIETRRLQGGPVKSPCSGAMLSGDDWLAAVEAPFRAGSGPASNHLRRFPDGCQFGLGRGSPYLGLQGGGKFIAG